MIPITFGLLVAEDMKLWLADFLSLQDAERSIGLEPGRVDHGTLLRPGVAYTPGLAYVVFEASNFLPAQSTYYAAINGRLIADRAVLYAFDERGETVDLERLPPVAFYGKGQGKVEAAIAAGVVIRPEIAVTAEGGPRQVLWQWPGPAPSDLAHLLNR